MFDFEVDIVLKRIYRSEIFYVEVLLNEIISLGVKRLKSLLIFYFSLAQMAQWYCVALETKIFNSRDAISARISRFDSSSGRLGIE